MEEQLMIHEFFVEGDDQTASHVLIHIAEPATADEWKRGYFFAITELNGKDAAIIERLQKIIDDAEAAYYAETTQTPEKAFEHIIEDINRKGHTLLENDGAIHAALGVIHGQHVSFATHGDMAPMLLYQKNEEAKQLHLFESDQGDVNNGQLFASVNEGTINTGDLFVFLTPHVSQFFSPDRLQKILAGRTIRDTAEHMERTLQGVNKEISFGGIFFAMVRKHELPKTGKRPAFLKAEAKESLEQFATAQKTTAQTLHPPLWKNGVERAKQLFAERKKEKAPMAAPPKQEETNHRPRPTPKAGKERLPNQLLIALGRAIVTGALGIWAVIRGVSQGIGKFSIGFFFVITNRHHQRAFVLSGWKHALTAKKHMLGKLPLASKLLLAGTVVFALVFFGSVGVFKIKENRTAHEQRLTDMFLSVQDKRDAAEARLLYGDEEGALLLLKEAKEGLAAFEQETGKDSDAKERASIMRVSLDDALRRFQKMTSVSSEAILRINEQKPDAKTASLAMLNDSLIAYGPEDPRVYLIDSDTKMLAEKTHDTLPHLIAASTPKEQDRTVFLDQNHRVGELPKGGETILLRDIAYPSADAAVTSLFVYNQRLYTLDPAHDQIYKHGKTQTGYDRGSAWLQEPVDLEGGVSFAIDGDIFVLTDTGNVIQLAGGKRGLFQLPLIEPSLEKPSAIWTYNDVNNLYILEPKNKRVIVLSKEGKLLAQYTDPAWQNPTGMVVEEAKKRIYILDNNTVYRFELST
ncbi:MAG: hypothetical protein AAB932_06665 [Patescibacteria group bacterium]